MKQLAFFAAVFLLVAALTASVTIRSIDYARGAVNRTSL